MKVKCKFCDNEFEVEKFIGDDNRKYSCGRCTRYCMEKCDKVKNNILSWHNEPCKRCTHNPYNRKDNNNE